MSLEFQERTDGFRVVRMTDHTADAHEQLIASLTTKQVNHSPADRMSDEALQSLAASAGVAGAVSAAEQYNADRKAGVTLWEPLPRAACTIHGAGGPLTVADVEEMLAHLPSE